MIELDQVAKSYGDKPALRGISLSAPPGQVLGYIGPNGAGKTTTVKILTAVLKPDSGTARVCGFDTGKDPVEVKRRVGYVPEMAALYESMTPLEFGRFAGRIHGLAEKTLAQRLDTFLRVFGLDQNRDEAMAGFSKGMKQKVLILAALLHNPQLLVLDEPLSGLDAAAALLLKEIVARLARQGRTVFFCSHLLDVVEKVCDRVVILDQGRVLADGSVAELREQSHSRSIEAAFAELTASSDPAALAGELIAALEEGGAA